jgi:hypothetical protein
VVQRAACALRPYPKGDHAGVVTGNPGGKITTNALA